MQKFVVFLLVSAMTAGCLIGCKHTDQSLSKDPKPVTTRAEENVDPETDSETDSIPSVETNSEAGSASSVETEFVVNEDTYWIAQTYYSEDGKGAEGPHPLDPEYWSIDLLLCADGTARFRDTHEDVCLMDDSYLDLKWEKDEENGQFLFYSKLYSMPVLVGVFENPTKILFFNAFTINN